MESIDKLRDYSHLDDDTWTLETGEIIHVFGSKPNDPNAINWGEQWRKIADEIEREIAERYMELPVDRKNEPWHIGDKFAFSDGPCKKRICTVSGVGVYEVFFFYYDEHASSTKHRRFKADKLIHHKPLTIEDVLRDMGEEVWNACCESQTTWSDSGLDGIEKRYADELRSMGVGE